MNTLLRRLLLVAAVMTAVVAGAASAWAEATPAVEKTPKRILVLHSYHPSFLSTAPYQQELRAAFREGYDLREEFLDTKRHSPEDMFRLARVSLTKKLEDWGAPDLVIAFDDNAAIFADDFRESLLGGAPVVFAGVNSLSRAKRMGAEPRITGVHERASIKSTLGLAAALNPVPLRRIVALIDDSPTSLAYQEQFWVAVQDFPHIKFETLSLSDYSLDEYLEKITAVGRPDTAIIALGTFRDKTGASFDTVKLYRRYAEVARRPIYVFFERYVEVGGAGGVVLSHRLQAREAARMGKRILAGEDPDKIDVLLESPNEVVLNARQIRRFGLRRSAVPAGARVLFDRPSFLQRNADILLSATVAVLAMLGVLKLVTSVSRRARERLQVINLTLEEKNEELQLAKAHIEHNALHDALTGLPNRRYVDRILARKHRDPSACFSVMQIDLDGFKQINDTLGHAAGDAVLQEVGQRLKTNVRDQDFVARIGGDEFIVVCEQLTDAAELKRLADRLIAALSEPVIFEDRACRFGASIGIASEAHLNATPRSLLIDVDFALYRAKSLGRNRAEFFSADLQKHIIETRELAEDIRRGLQAGEFKPHFQPQVDCQTLEITGVEALARWEHPEKGVLSPADFLETAESLNLVAQLDGEMLNAALAVFRNWRALGINLPRLSVNVSPKRLKQEDLPALFSDLDLPRGALSFELLESTFLDRDDPEIQHNIDRIREAGVDIEIDDFGSGHASIVSLIRLRPERLKLDRFLTTQLTESCEGVRVVRSILEIAESLKIGVIAEGVETLEQLRLLRSLGCGDVQGYLLAKPMDERAFADWIYTLPQRAVDLRRALDEPERSPAEHAQVAFI